MLRCAEDTCADTSHVAKSACVTTLRLRGWENRTGVRVSALGHTPGREGWPRRRRARSETIDLAARRSASGIDPRGVASVVPAPFDRDIPRRQKRRLLGGGGKRSRAGVGRRARDDAPGSLRRPRRAGILRRDATGRLPARRERGVPRAVVRDPFADPFAADLLAPAPVRGGHPEARGSAGARPHAEPPWDPFAPARAPPPVAAHYANPEADLEASLASDRRKRPRAPTATRRLAPRTTRCPMTNHPSLRATRSTARGASSRRRCSRRDQTRFVAPPRVGRARRRC